MVSSSTFCSSEHHTYRGSYVGHPQNQTDSHTSAARENANMEIKTWNDNTRP